MGKSYMSRHVLTVEFGFLQEVVDLVYSTAVFESGLSITAKLGSIENRQARKRARDRRWPDTTVRNAFFDAYRASVQDLLRRSRELNTPAVLEGGTLRLREEAGLVLDCAAAMYGETVKVVRVTVSVSYEQWLRNRMVRLAAADVETVRVAQLSFDNYERMVRAAEPEPLARVDDFRVQSIEELRALVNGVCRAAIDAPAAT